jgi:hypothetical protein
MSLKVLIDMNLSLDADMLSWRLTLLARHVIIG